MPSTANVKADIYEVTIGSLTPFFANINWSGGADVHMVTSGRTGTDPLVALVQGRGIEISIDVQETDAAHVRAGLNTSALGVAPAAGAQLAGVLLRIRHVEDTTNAFCLECPNFVVTNAGADHDGEEESVLRIEGMAVRDANGVVYRVGAP